MTRPAPAAIPAATLILFRERASGDPEILMVERARTMTFAGGALVFPGGRIDPGDHDLAATFDGHDRDETAARIAAIRETLEEAGVAIGLDPPPAPADIVRIRAGLHAGIPFATLLAETGSALRPDALEPFARWLPSNNVVRVFDTRFYLAPFPPGAAAATVDGTENVNLLWTTAADILARGATGEVKLIFPTRRNLERLARYRSFADAVADARAFPVRTISPTVQMRDGIRHICIPDGLGYPVLAEAITAADRG